MKTVLDPSDPTVDVKVTNRTGKEVTLRGWLNDEPALSAVPAHSAIVKLTFPEMTEGQAELKLSLTAEGVDDTEVHEVLLAAKGYGHHTPSPSAGTTLSPTTNPQPSMSESPKPHPSWSKSPKPQPSDSKSPKPQPSDSKSPKPQPSDSKSPKPQPSWSKSPKPQPSWSKSPKPQPSWSKSPKPSMSWPHTMTPSPHDNELPKTGDTVSSYVLLGGGLLVFGMFVLGLAWALGRRTASESAREG
ncbi:hypothetical protein Rhe02_68260 [Rhizocola hellebori]|uniref:Gram-positive cocci surface proteins LPxTG domain-containing protein n=1 Tax=Rhizocola hellebori TaxID=1392758 RepID=A0A8J3QDI3_9ACTN|nr:LPXTG cell wall anchor domain-containing protein [Rhizocola hellebori]GIH08759.1 hypothetical protein Rhe02_68260 [Rhizocola hellebori]